ncbi:MAG TPA: hypothetical protein VN429_11510 [Methanospirillum sp.]|uniref:hypothetical protein n=1 Tax=Methanospirillum sp. TaxID=45200 RepID=UPI002C4302DF|nr:hypothetical protein [Methanospirillum sp.]HWQ65036.1 hypothetical protein [Methanospirillum sp.]
MAVFVETMKPRAGFELCGRILMDNGCLLVFIDGVGKFSIPEGALKSVLLGLGDESILGPLPGIVRRSESGKGLYFDIGGISYATPVSRARAVMAGDQRKGPVSRVV